jgi:hypothetical protein
LTRSLLATQYLAAAASQLAALADVVLRAVEGHVQRLRDFEVGAARRHEFEDALLLFREVELPPPAHVPQVTPLCLSNGYPIAKITQ